jgi:rhamnosyltransferase subunit B
MRVLIVTLGSLGDLLPFLAIGKALRARGHDVCVGAGSRHEPQIRHAGLGFAEVLASATVQLPPEDARFWDLNRTWMLGWERVMAPAMRPAYELIREKAKVGPCVILAHWAVFGARLAAEKLGLPLCTVYLSPEALNACDVTGASGTRWRSFSEDEVFGPLLNAYRQELDLPPVTQICSHWVHSPQQGLALFPPWFCARRPEWPTQVTTTGFVTHDDALSPAPLPELEGFIDGGAPPIVFTPGTGMPHAAHFFRESLAACSAIGARALLLTPYAAHTPPNLPPWARHVDYIPLHNILGRAAALVYHGGIGTCAQAIRAGVPQLVAPMVVDQYDNAQHIEALGLGASVPMKHYERKLIAAKLTALLSDADVRTSCNQLTSRLLGDSVLDRTCDIIEGLY